MNKALQKYKSLSTLKKVGIWVGSIFVLLIFIGAVFGSSPKPTTKTPAPQAQVAKPTPAQEHVALVAAKRQKHDEAVAAQNEAKVRAHEAKVQAQYHAAEAKHAEAVKNAETEKRLNEMKAQEKNASAEEAEENSHEAEWKSSEGQELLQMIGEVAKSAGLDREQTACFKKRITESGSSVVEVLAKAHNEGANDEEIKGDAEYCREHA
jgi:type IV secretory pathway VirB10-like protein